MTAVAIGAVCAVAGAVMTLLLLGIGIWGMLSGFATKKETETWRQEIRTGLAAVIASVEKINGRISSLETWRQVVTYEGKKDRRRNDP